MHSRAVRRLAMPFRGFLALALVAFVATAWPLFAQAQVARMPDNAKPKSYGGGWECLRGFRQDGDGCVAIVLPDNAYATNRTYGAGWECLHGFREVGGTMCVKVDVPEGGYLDPSGTSWRCHRGYMRVDDLCEQIILPPNSYLADGSFGSVWLCDRGFEVDGETCAPIAVPENAFLNGDGFGKPWTCERGFVEWSGGCEAVIVPENAYFDESNYGPGWKCNRGFVRSGDSCNEIDIPENAHLDRSGNRWECHRNYQRTRGRCVQNN